MMNPSVRLWIGSLAIVVSCAACNLRPIVPFLPKTPEERLRSNPVALERSCTTCHTIGTTGGTVGPVLNQVANRRTVGWLKTWLRDPSAVKPGTKMPTFGFTETEIEILVADLVQMRRAFDTERILAEAGNREEAGKQLFETYDCYACHRIGSRGRYNGPDLTWVGRWQGTSWEKVWLHDPAAQRPGTFMPNFQLKPTEIEALTAFLHTLRGEKHDEDQRWKLSAYANKPIVRGELIFEKLGCRGCHGEHGTAGGFRNPNASPDEIVPALSRASERYDMAALKRLVRGPHQSTKLHPAGSDPPLVYPGFDGVLSDGELDDLAAYVISLGPKKSKWRLN